MTALYRKPIGAMSLSKESPALVIAVDLFCKYPGLSAQKNPVQNDLSLPARS